MRRQSSCVSTPSAVIVMPKQLASVTIAWMIDTVGNREARDLISLVKVAVPRAALTVMDNAIQIHGAAGVSDDTPLAAMWGWHRAMRLFDGPDEVHMRSIARAELKRVPLLPVG